MSEKEIRHWAEDEELLERFVLQQIEMPLMRNLDDHLQNCEQCRRRVEDERMLIAGVAALGRGELLGRLKDSLEAERRSTVPWPHIMGTAAVLALLIGVGVHNNWFTPRPDLISETSETPIVLPSDRHEAFEGEASVGKSGSNAREAPARETDTRARVRKEIAGIPLSDDIDMAERRSSIPPPAAGVGANRAVVSAPEQPQEIIADASGKEDVEKPLEMKTERFLPGQVQKSETQSRPRRPAARESLDVQIVQSDRPSAAQQRLIEMDRFQKDEVQVLAELESGTLYLTLFPSVRFSPAELANATTEFIDEDSLHIRIAGRVIRYHIPGRLQDALRGAR